MKVLKLISAAIELFAKKTWSIDRFYDYRTTLGFEPTDDSIFDHVENYLKDIAQI